MIDDEIPTIDDEARAMSLAYYHIQRDEIHRLRQSLREARELIEATVNSPHEFKDMMVGRKTLHVSTKVLDAARKWLEENGDD